MSKPKKPKKKTGAEWRAESGRVTITIEVTKEEKEKLRILAFAHHHQTPSAMLKAWVAEELEKVEKS